MDVGRASWRVFVGALLALAGFSACGGESHENESLDEAEITRGRLAVATSDTVVIVDLDDGATVGVLSVADVSSLHALPIGRYAYAFVADSDRVALLESGIDIESHGDHGHLSKGAPSLLDRRFFDGSAPFTIAFAEDWVAIFYAGDGRVRFVRERAIAAGSQEPGVVETGGAHEGFALAAKGALFTTVPADPGEGTTVEAAAVSTRFVRDLENEIGTGACPGVSAGALAGEVVVFPCADGLLVASVSAEAVDLEKRPFAPTERASPLRSFVASGGFGLGIDADGSLVRVEILADRAEISSVPVEGDVIAFAFDRRGTQIVVLAASGALLRFDAETLAMESPVEVIPPFVGNSDAAPRPSLAIGAEQAYVSDPRSGTVFEIELDEGTIAREFAIGGAPSNMVVFRISPDYDAHASHLHD